MNKETLFTQYFSYFFLFKSFLLEGFFGRETFCGLIHETSLSGFIFNHINVDMSRINNKGLFQSNLYGVDMV